MTTRLTGGLNQGYKPKLPEFEHKLLPLPLYSPEYNSIEKTWAHIKKHLKKVLPSCNTFFEALLSCSCFN